MRILFDLSKTQPIGSIKYHGGGKYGLVVLRKLLEISPNKVAVFYDDCLFVDPDILELIRKLDVVCYKKSQYSLKSAVKCEGGVLYSPLVDRAYLDNEFKKVIVTVHGLRNLEMPDDAFRDKYKVKNKTTSSVKTFFYNICRFLFPRKIQKKELSRVRNFFLSDNIDFITVSEHSKYSIMNFFPFIQEKRLNVFYSPSVIQKNLPLKDECENKFYLIVSGNRWVKNSVRGILAFDELFSEHPNHEGKVIVTGLDKASDIRIRLKNPERFEFLGYVDEIRLKTLYRSAYALLYPSLNEGFGYPPLEAMFEGTPVLASAIASIPEVCGDSVLYFNPYSIAEMKMRILQLENRVVYQRLVEKGKQRQCYIENRQTNDLVKLAEYLISFVKK